MARKPLRSKLTAVKSLTVVITIFGGFACRPIKIDKSNTGSSGGCPDATIAIGGTCVKDGFVYLLHDAVAGKIEQTAGKTVLSFGKQSLIKGDKLYATSRLTFPKATTGSNITLNYQLGSSMVGSSSSQFVGDPETVSIAHQTLTHQVLETTDAPVNLMISNGAPSSTNSDGTLLIFRQTQLAYALDPRVPKAGNSAYFLSDMLDTDKLKSSDLKVANSSTTVAELDSKNVRAGDILVIRSGSGWNIDEGKLNACDGASVLWSLAIDQKDVTTDGSHLLNVNRTIGSTSLQTIYKISQDTPPARIALKAKIDTGNKVERNSCVLKISEPTTLSVMVFRPIIDLPAEIQNARYLHDLGVVTAQPGKFSSNQSGPPIETLLTLNWDHIRSDALLTDTKVTLAAEDRIQKTKAYVQLSRAPDGLSSHIGKSVLLSPDRPRTLMITDMSLEQELTTKTRFYLTGMAFNNDAKNVLVNEAQIFFMHFRRIGDRL